MNSQPHTRREWLRLAAVAGAGALTGERAFAGADDGGDAVHLPFANGERKLVTYPQKRPLILLTSRPPQLETPMAVFNEGVLTPNDAFFVRYHLANIPLKLNDETFRLTVKGSVTTPQDLSVADLKTQFDQAEVTAVCQCSGNSRGFSSPRVGGGQLGNGAMGNAKWQGVLLKDVLAKAGVAADAKQVAFNGLDTPVMPTTPDFVKSLDVQQAMDGDIMIAHTMNGKPLPMLNGFPLRLVVPGYYGTYWVKHLSEITVMTEPFSGFWMSTAYRIPDTESGCIEPGTTPKSTIPINKLNVRSFITSHLDGATVKAGSPIAVRGIALDAGEGIKEVLFSSDGGQSWTSTKLGEDLGKYSFREWKLDLSLPPTPKKDAAWMVRAVNRIGQSQPLEALWNPSGYMRNVVETTTVSIL